MLNHSGPLLVFLIHDDMIIITMIMFVVALIVLVVIATINYQY